MMTPNSARRGFSLVELMVALAIISVLSAVLLPVFWTVRGKAREVVCVSNLRQIGVGFSLYLQDYDGRFPHAVDAMDRAAPHLWAAYPQFQADIRRLPLIQDALHPYLKSHAVFACPADSGFVQPDYTSVTMDAFPSSFDKFGSSYYYRTMLAARHTSESGLLRPAETHLMGDIVGQWHGTLTPLAQRYNILFADGHLKNLSRGELDGLRADSTSLPPPAS